MASSDLHRNEPRSRSFTAIGNPAIHHTAFSSFCRIFNRAGSFGGGGCFHCSLRIATVPSVVSYRCPEAISCRFYSHPYKYCSLCLAYKTSDGQPRVQSFFSDMLKVWDPSMAVLLCSCDLVRCRFPASNKMSNEWRHLPLLKRKRFHFAWWLMFSLLYAFGSHVQPTAKLPEIYRTSLYSVVH